MKKLLLLVASAAMIFSCSKDALNDSVSSGTPDDGSGQTRAGYRYVSADLTISNQTATDVNFLWGVISVDFFGKGAESDLPSSILSQPVNENVRSIAPGGTLYRELAPGGLMVLESLEAGRIDIVFDELIAYRMSGVEYKVWAEVYGNNNTLVKTTTAETISGLAWDSGTYTHSVDLSSVAQQNDYAVKIFVELFEPTTSSIEVNGYLDLKHNEYEYSTYDFYLDAVKLIGTDSEYDITPSSNEMIITNPTHLWDETYRYSYMFADGVTVDVDESITAVQLDFLSFADIDRPDVGFEVTVKIFSKTEYIGEETFVLEDGYQWDDNNLPKTFVIPLDKMSDQIDIEVFVESIPEPIKLLYTDVTATLTFTNGSTYNAPNLFFVDAIAFLFYGVGEGDNEYTYTYTSPWNGTLNPGQTAAVVFAPTRRLTFYGNRLSGIELDDLIVYENDYPGDLTYEIRFDIYGQNNKLLHTSEYTTGDLDQEDFYFEVSEFSPVYDIRVSIIAYN